jgi:hypothetical protein
MRGPKTAYPGSRRFLRLLAFDGHQHILLLAGGFLRLFSRLRDVRRRGFLADAPAQRLHQIDDVAGGWLLLRRDRLAGALLVDKLDQSGLVLVLELVRLESSLMAWTCW